jgi:hypothetical protein
VLDVALRELGSLQGGVGGGETGQRIGVVHLQEQLVGLYLLADIDVDLLDRASDLRVRLEVGGGLDGSVGGGGLDEVSVGDLGDIDSNALAREGADRKTGKDEHDGHRSPDDIRRCAT